MWENTHRKSRETGEGFRSLVTRKSKEQREEKVGCGEKVGCRGKIDFGEKVGSRGNCGCWREGGCTRAPKMESAVGSEA